MSDVKLTPTGYAVLGLLSFGQPLSGYEIRKWARASFAHFYPAPAQSQVYGELEKLESLGYVTGTEVAQFDRPAKISFTTTAAGIAALELWATSAVPAPTIKHHVALRVFFGHTASTSVLISLLEEHRDRLLVGLEELETHSATMTGEPETGHAAIVADWIAEMHRGDLRGTEHTLKCLHEGVEHAAPSA